jgi:hypothetical protein
MRTIHSNNRKLTSSCPSLPVRSIVAVQAAAAALLLRRSSSHVGRGERGVQELSRVTGRCNVDI